MIGGEAPKSSVSTAAAPTLTAAAAEDGDGIESFGNGS